LASLPFISKNLAIWGIDIYQHCVSPYKGWKCSYAIAHLNESSCSEFGKESIKNLGIVVGLKQIQSRFKECETSYFALGIQKNAERGSCCGGVPTVQPKLIDVHKSEGTLIFAYETVFRQVNVDWTEAQKEATERCKSWGFTSAHFLDAIKNCMGRDLYGNCVNFQVIHKCECKN
jgi:putative component of membrane protein insertase Oxa1/YidC/SpoIIIJ protein YidD